VEKRQLGRSGLRVSPLCFGGNVFGWTADAATSFRLLDRFVDAGLDFVDTADVYSAWAPGNKGGESETILGDWFAQGGGRRERIVLATKVGSPMGEGKKGLSRRYVKEAVEASLKRLRTDRIDLYQSHWDDPETPFEETLGAYADLIREGKVRAIGASNLTAARLTEALETSAGFEGDLERVCREHGLGVITYFSLARGFLTGKYRSQADLGQSPRGEGVAKYLDERGRRILAALDEIAARHGAKPASVALAWLIAKPAVTAPIASATKPEQLEDLIAAATLALDAEEVAHLDRASDPA
jgi:aryl-alcohol dehydrogenase-like predicted oxidoreductase